MSKTKTWTEAIRANNEAMVRLTNPELERVLPILRHVREETAEALAQMPLEDGVSFSMHRRAQLLRQLDAAFQTADKVLPHAMNTELAVKSHGARKVGLSNLQSMMDAGARRFGDHEPPLRLDVVRIIGNTELTAMSRYPASASRYAGKVGQRIRSDMMVGIITGESLDSMARRMAVKDYQKAAARGQKGLANAISKRQFFRNHADAMRLLRTELNNAYNEIQIEGLTEADKDDPGWKKRWDATNDGRTCSICWRNHDEVRDLDESFTGGVRGPPLHPHDRCTLVPHRDEWKR